VVDADESRARADLVVEVVQEAEPDETVDAVAGGEVEDVDAEVGEREAERRG